MKTPLEAKRRELAELTVALRQHKQVVAHLEALLTRERSELSALEAPASDCSRKVVSDEEKARRWAIPRRSDI